MFTKLIFTHFAITGFKTPPGIAESKPVQYTFSGAGLRGTLLVNRVAVEKMTPSPLTA